MNASYRVPHYGGAPRESRAPPRRRSCGGTSQPRSRRLYRLGAGSAAGVTEAAVPGVPWISGFLGAAPTARVGFLDSRSILHPFGFKTAGVKGRTALTESRGIGRGGPRPGSGRKSGSNKRRPAQYQAVDDGQELPLAYMLRVMKDESQPLARRDKMAVHAAPYLHARLIGNPIGSVRLK